MGIVGATYLGVTNGNSTSQVEEQKDDDSASANVVASDEAAKKDKDGNLTAAGVAQKAMDSCVGITVYTQQSAYSYFNSYGSSNTNGEDVASGEGSGVVMSQANGKTYIMTCAHVINGGNSFIVTANNGKKYDAKMLAISDIVQPESTVTVYDYIRAQITQQKQMAFVQKAAQDMSKSLNVPENVEMKKSGAALDKLLDCTDLVFHGIVQERY